MPANSAPQQDLLRKIGIALALLAGAWGLVDRMTAELRTTVSTQGRVIQQNQSNAERRRKAHVDLRNELHEHMRVAHGRLTHLETTGEQ